MSSSATLIESTFLSTHKSLLQLLKRRLGCGDTAEDLVQETYLRLIQQESLGNITNLTAYLFRTALNLTIDHRRQAVAFKHAQHEPLEEDLICPNPLPDTLAEADQTLAFLDRIITELPPQCRRIFLLRKVQNLSHAEIATQLGISPRTVETQISKALKILRNRIGAHDTLAEVLSQNSYHEGQ